jgi:hypothetical protein
MVDPVTAGATAILTVIGGILGASEKGLTLLQKVWPDKAPEDGTLVKLAKDLPQSQRDAAVSAMRSVYATISSATEQVKHVQHAQRISSINQLVLRTIGIAAVAIGAQSVLEHLDKPWVWGAVAVPASCFFLSAVSGWDSIKVYAPKLTPYLNKVTLHPKVEQLSDLFAQATKAASSLSTKISEELEIPTNTVLAEKFLESYEALMAKVESLEFYCLGLQFVQADDKLKTFCGRIWKTPLWMRLLV